jgi:serine/threonine protein kinase
VRGEGYEEELAMKTEPHESRKQGLETELYVLTQKQHCCYFSHLITWGMTNCEKYVVMEHLGPSLSTVRRTLTNQRYSVSTALRLSLVMLQSLQAFHCRGFVHCDVKPSNFLFRFKSASDCMDFPPLVLIDYGISERLIHYRTRQYRAFKGTLRYASPNAQKMHHQSPVDDLISWLYSTVEIVDGYLPWEKERDFRRIRKWKSRIAKHDLVRNLPSQFLDIARYLKTLTFRSTVDYHYLISLLSHSIIGLNSGFCCPYDWEFTPETGIEGISKLNGWKLPQGCDYLKSLSYLKNQVIVTEEEKDRCVCSIA